VEIAAPLLLGFHVPVTAFGSTFFGSLLRQHLLRQPEGVLPKRGVPAVLDCVMCPPWQPL
jgi:hypothetical protein